MQMMRSSVLPSQEGFAFWSRMLRKLEKAPIVTPLASPPKKRAHSLGAMLPPFLLMEIHSNYNFTKKKAKHKVVLVNFYFQHKVIYCSHV
jgi:hypothetical protein